MKRGVCLGGKDRYEKGLVWEIYLPFFLTPQRNIIQLWLINVFSRKIIEIISLF